jgi:hypothetical protein
VADQDYRLNAANGQLLRLSPYNGAVMWWEALPVTVAYEAGFSTIPDDIEDAVIRMIRARWFARNRDPYLMSETIPGVREARWWIATGDQAGNMPPDVVDLLENYRVPVAL